MVPTETIAAIPAFQEPWTRFAAWAVDELCCALAFDGTTYRLEQDTFDANRDANQADSNPSASKIRRRWSLRRSAKTESVETDAEATGPLLTATTQTELLKGLIAKLEEKPTPANLCPQYEPEAVHELTDRLFDAYELDGGKALVAGCHLEEIPFIRFTQIGSVNGSATEQENTSVGKTDDGSIVLHRYFDIEGEAVSAKLVKELGLNETKQAKEPLPRLSVHALDQITTFKKLMVEDVGLESSHLLAIVWARRASGRLRFEFGDQSVEAPFEGWAKTLTAPPVVCPRTGRETFSLTSLDNHEIVASEEVVRCEVTGHRHVAADLERCSVTGKQVEPDLLKPCPLSGDLVLTTEFGTCPRCRLSIPQKFIDQTGCQICHGAKRIEANHPSWSAIQAKYAESARISGRNFARPQLRWQMAETDDTIVLVHDGWFRRRVATFDKSTLELKHQAEASRFSNTWCPV